ncbi:hypothetical protein ACHHYP_11085 [Achlya hypogyna]|uniref:Uncharacterized protein n=1 Tax=Achlya hypogyna TaxID=1202772 RepID=A0A1V9YJZ8_ACHHY|nr:hypothetical protein ACHHYP_11085 [Achlya hypogyna]
MATARLRTSGIKSRLVYPSGATSSVEAAAKLATTERDVAIEEAAAALVEVHAAREESRKLKEELDKLQNAQMGRATSSAQLLDKLWSVVHKIHGASFNKAQLYQLLVDQLCPSLATTKPPPALKAVEPDASLLVQQIKSEVETLLSRSEASVTGVVETSTAQLSQSLQLISRQLEASLQCADCVRLSEANASHQELQAMDEKIEILFQQLEHEQRRFEEHRARDTPNAALAIQLKASTAKVHALEHEAETQGKVQLRLHEDQLHALREKTRVLEARLEHESAINMQLQWEMQRKASKELEELTKTNTELGQEFYEQSQLVHDHECEIRELTKTVEWLQQAWQDERGQRLHFENIMRRASVEKMLDAHLHEVVDVHHN